MSCKSAKRGVFAPRLKQSIFFMTIYEIKQATQATAPYFFERKTLRFFGQTLRDFRTYKQRDGRVMICAPMYNNGRKIGETVRFFNPDTNSLDRE